MTKPDEAAGVVRSVPLRLIVVAAAVVVLVVVVAALVLPRLLSSGAGASLPDVADIPREPRTTWTFDWVGEANPEFLDDAPRIAAVGDDRALVWARFDAHAFAESQGDSAAWYEGYDEQYAQGYEAGLEYEIAYERWIDDTTFSAPRPRDEDFYPAGAYGNFDEWLGFDDGFWDARLGEPEGFSKKQEPVAPDYSPTLTLLDTSTGSAVWTIDLSEVIEGVDYSSTFYALDVPGSDVVAVSASRAADRVTTYSVVTLDKADGSRVSELESDGVIGIQPFDGDLVVTTTGSDGEDTMVSRFEPTSLGSEPVWRERGPDSSNGATLSRLGADYLRVLGDDGGIVLEGGSGEEADFGGDLDVGVDYAFAGDRLVRIERSDDSTRVEGWRTTGESAWSDAADADYARVVDGMVLTADADGDSYSGLTAIDPSTGEPLWTDAWDGGFDGVYAVRNGSVLVMSGSRLEVLDAATGAARFSQRLGDLVGLYEGSQSFYVATGDTLTAYDYASKGGRWSIELADDETVTVVGRTLGVIEQDEGTLRGLAPR